MSKYFGWSQHYLRCIDCGTTEIAFAAHGLCLRCYHLLNRVKSLKRSQYRYLKNKESIKLKTNLYRLANPVIVSESQKRYRMLHREKIKHNSQIYYNKNRQFLVASSRLSLSSTHSYARLGERQIQKDLSFLRDYYKTKMEI